MQSLLTGGTVGDGATVAVSVGVDSTTGGGVRLADGAPLRLRDGAAPVEGVTDGDGSATGRDVRLSVVVADGDDVTVRSSRRLPLGDAVADRGRLAAAVALPDGDCG